MKFPFNVSFRRNIALRVLLVWLLALASGMANACLLELRETHSHAAATATATVSFDPAQTPAIVPGHAGAVADRKATGQPHPKAPCLKVCDDGSRAFPSLVSTVAHIDPGPALRVQLIWSTVAPDVLALRQIDDPQPATPELPIRVRFSRLAI